MAVCPVVFPRFSSVVVAGLPRPPPVPETFPEETAAIKGLVVQVGVGTEGDHRFEMGRLQALDSVLGDRQGRHSPQPDVSVGPRLLSTPFHSVLIIIPPSDHRRGL